MKQVQFRVVINNIFAEKCIDYQKCCLGGKITSQDDITSRLDTADSNHKQSCGLCYIKGYKTSGACDTDGCPAKYAYRRVVQTLFRISDALQENPDLDLPYIKASDYSLDYIIELYEEAIKKAKSGPITGLDKIKNLFGGK